ncbi:cupin [Salegentibacter salinarum]|uniref:Cupin n=1 Tax=Salegentibacter salinarum TaxID=447422 RepID=A0A2N0U044_9FLAO|nr:cupin domain-containing protein [Salegentibacter salinarum]PKD20371.1 cupin [Salegentibacter salinarum]SKB85553.1 Cupin domain protein [Salegentibacter salinarum]
MKKSSLTENLEYSEKSPAVKVLFETEVSKEIRMAFKKDQGLKEHKTPFPIVVEIFEGAIDFGVNGEKHPLKKGDLITLEGNVPHDLKATENSIVRLSLTKADTTQRVENVAKNS